MCVSALVHVQWEEIEKRGRLTIQSNSRTASRRAWPGLIRCTGCIIATSSSSSRVCGQKVSLALWLCLLPVLHARYGCYLELTASNRKAKMVAEP